MRDCYTKDGRRIIVVTDRISAFDVVLGTIPFKGQVLNQIAAHWFELSREVVAQPRAVGARSGGDGGGRVQAAAGRVRHALLPDRRDQHLDLAALRAGRARASAGTRCPRGCARTSAWQRPLLTPSTKADKGGHDESVSREEILKRGLLSADEFDEAAADVRPPVRLRPGRGGQARPDPGRHQVRDRPPPRRHPVLHRRDPHARTARATGTPTTTRRASPGARSRAGWTRSTSAARWPSRATAARGRRRR